MLGKIDEAWVEFDGILEEYLKKSKGVKVLEIGAGANACISNEQILKYNIDFYITDIDKSELLKNTSIGKKIPIAYDEEIFDSFDIIITKMVLEHVKDPSVFHGTVRRLLKDSGIAIHFFATKYSLSSTLNILLPGVISDWLISKLQSRSQSNEGKFKAYYKNCFGPVKKRRKWVSDLGFDVITDKGFLGTNYCRNYSILNFFETVFNKIIYSMDSAWFCSNAIIVLSKKKKN